MQLLYHKTKGVLGILIPELIIELQLLQLCL